MKREKRRQDKARQGKARQDKTATQHNTRQGNTAPKYTTNRKKHTGQHKHVRYNKEKDMTK